MNCGYGANVTDRGSDVNNVSASYTMDLTAVDQYRQWLTTECAVVVLAYANQLPLVRLL